jgi:PIN domain nuclease of toxin-antitoxin system
VGNAKAVKILLDTCCIIWAVSQPTALSRIATELLVAEESEIHVSPISAAELACAVARGRVELNSHWKKCFRYYIDLNGWRLVDIDLGIIEEAYCLPETFHADPADRILTATARINGFTLLTADDKILGYPHVATRW